MRLIYDGLFRYVGWWESQCCCWLRVYTDDAGQRPHVAIVSELAHNTGTSVTNMAERLRGMVAHKLDLDPDCLLWVEHYPPSTANRPDGERYSVVVFVDERGRKMRYPTWQHRTRGRVEDLIGQPLRELVEAYA
jgi:hypothetical protein